MEENKSAHELAAQDQPHDEHGRFTKKPDTSASKSLSSVEDHTSPTVISPSGTLTDIIQKEIKVENTSDPDTLVDVHVGNPISPVKKIWEEIKKQKAFSFSIKGSLGLAGIIIAISAFSIFGGTKIMCLAGQQSHIGVLMQLNIKEGQDSLTIVDRIVNLWNRLTGQPVKKSKRPGYIVVLVQEDKSVLQIKGEIPENLLTSASTVIITGDMDSCSRTITLKGQSAIQELPDNLK